MSTTVLSLGGVAQAAAVETTNPFAVTYDYDGATDTWTVPAGYCSIDWHLEGAQGGAGSGAGEDGLPGGFMDLVTYIDDTTVATTFEMAPGQTGGAAAGDGLTGGAAGLNHLASDVDGDFDGFAGDTDGVSVAGGGGGAASAVTGPDGFELYTYGGDGGGTGGGLGGMSGVSNYFATTSEPPVTGVDTDGGAGSVSATATLCMPAEPSAWLEGDDGKIFVHLTEGAGGEAPTTGYEYTRDAGTTWSSLSTTTVDGRLVGTISGLTNGTEYTVQVRATAANGAASEATEPQTVMAYKPIGAPANVVATKGPSSIVITWDAPTTTGTFDLAGYVVGASARKVDGSDGADGYACETAADVRRCVVTAEPGWNYSFFVTPVDAEDNPGYSSDDVTVSDVPLSAVPSSTVPAKTGDLVVPAGQSTSVAPGAKVRVTGAGYLPGSTVTMVVYSDPQVLTTTVADADGKIDVTVTVPAGLAAGNHTLVASGVDAQGNMHYLTLPITVTGGTTGSGGLAYTGASIALPLGGGAAALLLGGGLLVAARRRSAA